MEYRVLGKTGVKVSTICLGTMNFGSDSTDEKASHKILDKFVEKGGNFIDTADVYNKQESERVIGKWLKHRKDRSKLVVATKVHFGTGTGPNDCGLSRSHILDTVDQQLERLQTPYIDLLQIHNWDSLTPVEEWVGTFRDLIRDGKIRFMGVCNVTGWQLAKICNIAANMGVRVASAQCQYSLLSRHTEWEVLDCCEHEGVSLLPWSALKGGWLTGKIKKDAPPPPGSRVAAVQDGKRANMQSSPSYDQYAGNVNVWGMLDAMEKIAASFGEGKVTVSQVALRWLLQRPQVPSVLIGPKNEAQLEDCMGAASFTLSAEQMDELNKTSATANWGASVPYPYEMVWRACRPENGRLDGNLWPRANPQ